MCAEIQFQALASENIVYYRWARIRKEERKVNAIHTLHYKRASGSLLQGMRSLPVCDADSPHVTNFGLHKDVTWTLEAIRTQKSLTSLRRKLFSYSPQQLQCLSVNLGCLSNSWLACYLAFPFAATDLYTRITFMPMTFIRAGFKTNLTA